MIPRMTRWCFGAATLVASSMAAQGPTSTGVNTTGGFDNAWTAAYSSASASGGPSAAAVVTSPPGVWAANVGGSYQWISVVPSASLGIGATSYVFSTTFDLTGYDPSTAVLTFRYALDNVDLGYSLNGGANLFGAGGGFQFGAVQTLSTGFVSGINSLAFYVTGDSQTDGLLVDVQSFSVRPASTVPEPTTVALTATGLLALAGIARRRIRA